MKDKNLWWYTKTYDQLIQKAKLRGLDKSKLEGYYEKHHIVPKSLGGQNKKDNLVLLTYREHIIAHKLLIRIYNRNQKMIYAYYSMIRSSKREKTFVDINVSSKELEAIRIQSVEYLREINTGEKNPMYGKKISEDHKKKISEANKYKRSEETKQKMREAQLGKKANMESRVKMSNSHKGLKIHTEERKKFLSERWKNNNPNSKKVYDSNLNKVYETLTSCAKDYNISSQTLRKWIRNNPEKGFSYYTTD